MKANRPHNQLRIIGGAWRGRKLRFAPLPGLRPTPDRVRETLFNWLAPVIQGARCLDLYAGSGALGLEAASRGAAEVVLVDRSAEVATSLREQLTLLGEPQIQAVQADVQQWLRANAAGPGQPPPFDIVFLDPPFHSQLLPDDVQLLEDKGWLSPEAWIYIEAQKGLNLELPANWSVHRSKQAGQVSYQLIKRT